MTPSLITVPTNGKNFFSSGLRSKVDALMDILYAGGVNNPMDSIEQISYLIFLRLLTEKDDKLAAMNPKYSRIFSGKGAKYSWNRFVTLAGDELFETVRGAMESIHDLPGLSETGKLLFSRATLKIYDRPTLRAVIQSIHEMDLSPHGGQDLKGDMYEYLLGKIAMSGTNGQFRTPRHIIDMIVAIVDPKPMETICDPACGTAGFLISAFHHILRTNTKPEDLEKGMVDGTLMKPKEWKHLEEMAFTGFDNDANMVKIAILNLYLHGLEKAKVDFYNPLTTNLGGTYPGRTFDIILANPPFAGSIQKESILSDINLPTRSTELLFVKWMIDHLSLGGRAGIIVPNNVLFDTSRAGKRLREEIMNNCSLEAIVSLPPGVFRPYSDSETAVIFFKKGSKTEAVLIYQVSADGFTLDDSRTPIHQNDFPDVIKCLKRGSVSSRSFIIKKDDILSKNGILLPGEYRSEHTAIEILTLPKNWSSVKLNEIVEETNIRAGDNSDILILSITKHEGFVESLKYFKKKIYSNDISNYKIVKRGEFAYSTIHLDEGSIARLESHDSGLISPLYKVFRLIKSEELIDPTYLLYVLKSKPFIIMYKNIGKGSVKRRKSILFNKFSSLTIPLPPLQIQKEISLKARKLSKLKKEIIDAEWDLNLSVEKLLNKIGI